MVSPWVALRLYCYNAAFAEILKRSSCLRVCIIALELISISQRAPKVSPIGVLWGKSNLGVRISALEIIEIKVKLRQSIEHNKLHGSHGTPG